MKQTLQKKFTQYADKERQKADKSLEEFSLGVAPLLEKLEGALTADGSLGVWFRAGAEYSPLDEFKTRLVSVHDIEADFYDKATGQPLGAATFTVDARDPSFAIAGRGKTVFGLYGWPDEKKVLKHLANTLVQDAARGAPQAKRRLELPGVKTKP